MKAKILMLLVALLMGNLSVMSQDVIELNGSVTVGSHKDHYWVDLDLSVKWATRNMGAEDAYKVGSYYSRENGSDPAATIWGGNWRMPTIDEWVELVLNCDWKWIKSEEFTGALGTSKNVSIPSKTERNAENLPPSSKLGRILSRYFFT